MALRQNAHAQQEWRANSEEAEPLFKTRAKGLRPEKLWIMQNRQRLVSLTAVIVFLVLWEVAATFEWINPLFSSSPLRVFDRAYIEITNGAIWDDIFFSGYVFLIGFSLALVVGIIIGILAGWFDIFNATVGPFVSALYATPRISFLPLLVILLGIGAAPKVVIVFFSAVIPIIINTQAGVRSLDSNLLRTARSFSATSGQIFRTIALPGSIPFIISGVRVSTGHALIGVLVGEMYGSFKGLGHMIFNAGARFDTDLVLLGAMLFSLAGMALNSLVLRIGARFEAWRPVQQ